MPRRQPDEVALVERSSTSSSAGDSCASVLQKSALLRSELASSTEDALLGILESSAAMLRQWDPLKYKHLNRLQEAARNKGSVELMEQRGTGRQVAVKCMPMSWTCESADEFRWTYPKSIEKPWVDVAVVKHLNSIKYPYACELLGAFTDGSQTLFVSSLATEGDLFSWCDRDDPRPMAGSLEREQVIKPLAFQIFQAVRWLHELGIAHRDLSLENILLTRGRHQSGLQVKLIDFGMSTTHRVVSHELRGKEAYFAPEMHLEDAVMDTFLADCFSLGVVLFAMASQDYPWTSTRPNKCGLFQYICMFGIRRFLEKRKLRKGGGEFLIEVFSPQFVEVVEGLLRKDPLSRMSLGESCWERGAYEGEGSRKSVWATDWMAEGRDRNEGWASYAQRSLLETTSQVEPKKSPLRAPRFMRLLGG